LVIGESRDPALYWAKFDALRPAGGSIPRRLLEAALPDPHVPYRALRRVAGVGSLGRPRIVALATWAGARVAREAKAQLPSAAVWGSGKSSAGVDAAALLRRAMRTPDPCLTFHDGWIIRRLAPDCSRVELDDLPKVRDEKKLLRAMGWEAGNMHLGARVTAIRSDLRKRPRRWLERAAVAMADAVERDWSEWVRR